MNTNHQSKLNPWQTLASKYLIQDRWLTLRADRCQNQSVILDPFYVFEYKPWVTIVPITSKQDVVLIKQYRHGAGCIETELPAGSIEDSDTSIVAAAQRELREETGYSAEKFEFVGKMSPNTSSHNNESHVYVAINAHLTDQQNLDSTEEIEVFTVPLEQIPKMISDGEFSQAMHIAALHYALLALGKIEYNI